jgi:hypothetical protein
MQGRHIREQSYMHDEPARPVRTKFCTHISSHCVRELRVPCAKHTHTVRDKPCTQINDPQLQALQLIIRITRSQRSNMYCFVMLEDEHDRDDIQLAFLRIDTLYGYFAMLVMQLMEGINVHVAPPDRIDWWRGSVTCLR